MRLVGCFSSRKFSFTTMNNSQHPTVGAIIWILLFSLKSFCLNPQSHFAGCLQRGLRFVISTKWSRIEFFVWLLKTFEFCQTVFFSTQRFNFLFLSVLLLFNTLSYFYLFTCVPIFSGRFQWERIFLFKVCVHLPLNLHVYPFC